ncbi:putative phage-related protein [Methylocella tundrae]|uniref:Putative phage-related protein n=2 Tax=Methylocella tundrae TaxID=227605 RepID=A0A8B6MCN7_METTU|nr:putative phage-related protein [Methylocella tundrae]
MSGEAGYHLGLEQNLWQKVNWGITMPAMTKVGTTDADIRFALHAKRLRRAKSHPDTLVIDELGLAHARSRIDVAVINGCIHGYEIKSAKDNLDRFATQIDIYRQTLQKLTLVAAPKHVAAIMSHAPEWCGVIAAEQGPRGGINFQVLRNAAANPEIDPVMMAHLLWRDEVIQLLGQAGYAAKDLRRPRKQLYEMLCEAMTLREITASIRAFMVRRHAWRDRPAHA